MATRSDRSAPVQIYVCGGSLFRVNGRVECLIGPDWVPSQLTLDALREAGARLLAGQELERLRAHAG